VVWTAVGVSGDDIEVLPHAASVEVSIKAAAVAITGFFIVPLLDRQ
jgi:hypothetical protein